MSTPISPSPPAASTPPALAWRLLQPADLDAMEVLHRLSLAGMAAHTVKAESRDFLASLLQGRGQVIGAWAGQALVAYGVSVRLGVEPTRFTVAVPDQSVGMFVRVAALGVLCALVSILFCKLMHGAGHLMKRIKNP